MNMSGFMSVDREYFRIFLLYEVIFAQRVVYKD